MNFTFDLTITLGLIATLALAILGAWRMRNKTVDARIDGCGERLDRQEQRIHSVEQALQSLPRKEDLHSLSLSLSDMRGEMREIRASVQGQSQIMSRLEAVVSRQEDHLMRGGKS
ncbi:DUF2730 family protein [Paracoccus sp. ME4]|uniref:DUF2730 family protein n=1 Tax=Paracoccus sp. ME4 TaxID=3138066 RepID=UPI00398AABC9